MKQVAASDFPFIEPMRALRVRDLPSGDWIYEMKFDGYRALAFKAGKEVRLISRNQIDFGNDYPQLIDSLKLLTAENVIIDGEIAAPDSNGKTSFQLLQSFPDMIRACSQSSAILRRTQRAQASDVPLRAFELFPTMQAKRLVRCSRFQQ